MRTGTGRKAMGRKEVVGWEELGRVLAGVVVEAWDRWWFDGQ